MSYDCCVVLGYQLNITVAMFLDTRCCRKCSFFDILDGRATLVRQCGWLRARLAPTAKLHVEDVQNCLNLKPETDQP